MQTCGPCRTGCAYCCQCCMVCRFLPLQRRAQRGRQPITEPLGGAADQNCKHLLEHALERAAGLAVFAEGEMAAVGQHVQALLLLPKQAVLAMCPSLAIATSPTRAGAQHDKAMRKRT